MISIHDGGSTVREETSDILCFVRVLLVLETFVFIRFSFWVVTIVSPTGVQFMLEVQLET